MTPPEIEQAIDRGLAEHRAGRRAQAEAIYRSIIAAHPHHALALDLLGILRHELGDHAQAETLLLQACAADQNEAQYPFDLGSVLHSTGRTDEALQWLERSTIL